MTTVPFAVEQLIYTNVEADFSPTRQRGFQVWLASRGISTEQKRGIARRIDDFRLPGGVTASGPLLQRHTFFRLSADGPFVIARTVPMSDRDKFGRGGKFFAHAVVIPVERFREIGSNPFCVIDGGFSFLAHPSEIVASGYDWKSGEPPPANANPVRPSAEETRPSAQRLAELLAHVERADERPVVVVEKADVLLAVLRAVFRLFPPRTREALSFDTLSTGAFLQQFGYTLVGGFSADHLRTWAFRRYIRFDLAAGTFSPALDKPTSALPGEFFQSPGLPDVSDDDRGSLFDAAKALAESKLHLLPTLSMKAAGVLDACPAAQMAVTAAVPKRLEDVPTALLALPGVRESLGKRFDGNPSQALTHLAKEVPRATIEEALLAAFNAAPTEPLSATVLSALENWLKQGTSSEKLHFVLYRWRGKEADTDRLIERLGTEDSAAIWLREWLTASLGDAATGGPEVLTRNLPLEREARPEFVRDGRLALALRPNAAESSWSDAKLRLAYHRGASALREEITRLPRGTAVSWLAAVAARRFQTRYEPIWYSEGPSETFLGLGLLPERTADEALLETAAKCGKVLILRVLQTLQPFTQAETRTQDEVEPPTPETIKKRYQKVLSADPTDLKGAVRSLRERLTEADDDAYRWAGNLLLQKVYGEPVLRTFTDEVYFIGLKLVWIQFDQPAKLMGLFDAVAGAAVRELPAGDVPDPNSRMKSAQQRRFAWLLTRLNDPVGTGRLRI